MNRREWLASLTAFIGSVALPAPSSATPSGTTTGEAALDVLRRHGIEGFVPCLRRFEYVSEAKPPTIRQTDIYTDAQGRKLIVEQWFEAESGARVDSIISWVA